MNNSDILQSLAMGLIVLGIVFVSGDTLISYAFLGAGVILSVISLIMRRKHQTHNKKREV